jgi:hypothetical protein
MIQITPEKNYFCNLNTANKLAVLSLLYNSIFIVAVPSTTGTTTCQPSPEPVAAKTTTDVQRVKFGHCVRPTEPPFTQVIYNPTNWERWPNLGLSHFGRTLLN